MNQIKLTVAVTDPDWYSTLSTEPELEEVNHWASPNKNFKALNEGELFLFKLKKTNFIVGGGVFCHAPEEAVSCSMAWKAFGIGNGCKSLIDLKKKAGGIIHKQKDFEKDYSISCRVLTQPFFFPEPLWIPTPESWNPSIQQYKTYSTINPEGYELWEKVSDKLSHFPSFRSDKENRYGTPQLIKPRLGQGMFRYNVIDAYKKCAVTGEHTLPVLEAAHIKSFAKGGKHMISNGLLLRSDLHNLFDQGYVTVSTDYKFEVSHLIHEEFNNGKVYYAMHGNKLLVPDNPKLRPEHEALEWHHENCYKG